MCKMRVIRKPITRLRRGDKIIAIRPAEVEREAGINQHAPSRGAFSLRHDHGDGTLAVVYRRPDGEVVGHESSYIDSYVAFVLVEASA